MSYTAFPSASFAAVPTATDDNTKGYVVGSQWTNTAASPRAIYLCTDAYAVATGPVPPGQLDLASRVTLEAQPDDAVPNMSEGYDVADVLVVRFFC